MLSPQLKKIYKWYDLLEVETMIITVDDKTQNIYDPGELEQFLSNMEDGRVDISSLALAESPNSLDYDPTSVQYS